MARQASPQLILPMYDTHCHILSGMDDGAQDFYDSLEIARRASNSGVIGIIATPHYKQGVWEAGCNEITKCVNELNCEIKKYQMDITIFPGMEIFLAPNLINLYETGKIMALNNKKYMLLELPMYSTLPPYVEDVIFQLQVLGVRPIIAHPERCKAIMENPSIIYDLIGRDCLMQIDSGSIGGTFGKYIQKIALILLKHNMVHMIASDSHTSNGRMGLLYSCYRIITKKFGQSIADNLFVYNPQRVIEGRDISVECPMEIRKTFREK